MLSAARLPQVRAEACISLQASWEQVNSSNCPNHVRRTKSSIKKRIIVRRTVRSMFGEQTFAQLRTGFATCDLSRPVFSVLTTPYLFTGLFSPYRPLPFYQSFQSLPPLTISYLSWPVFSVLTTPYNFLPFLTSRFSPYHPLQLLTLPGQSFQTLPPLTISYLTWRIVSVPTSPYLFTSVFSTYHPLPYPTLPDKSFQSLLSCTISYLIWPIVSIVTSPYLSATLFSTYHSLPFLTFPDQSFHSLTPLTISYFT